MANPGIRASVTHSPSRPQAENESGTPRLGQLPFGNHFESSFLRGLSNDELLSVVASASQRQFPERTVVYHQGDPALHLFLLVKGSARYVHYTHEGRKLLLMWLAPGDAFGGSALLAKASRYLCAVEMEKGSQALVWERDTIRSLAARYPKLLENTLSIANDYFVWYLATHVALTCRTARERVAQVLINLARGVGQDLPQGTSLEITNEQLADASSVTLFTASRLMAEWRRSGALSKGRGKVVLHFPERLLARKDRT